MSFGFVNHFAFESDIPQKMKQIILSHELGKSFMDM